MNYTHAQIFDQYEEFRQKLADMAASAARSYCCGVERLSMAERALEQADGSNAKTRSLYLTVDLYEGSGSLSLRYEWPHLIPCEANLATLARAVSVRRLIGFWVDGTFPHLPPSTHTPEQTDHMLAQYL